MYYLITIFNLFNMVGRTLSRRNTCKGNHSRTDPLFICCRPADILGIHHLHSTTITISAVQMSMTYRLVRCCCIVSCWTHMILMLDLFSYISCTCILERTCRWIQLSSRNSLNYLKP